MRPDIAEHADGIRIGVKPVGKMAILGEPVQKVLQGMRSRRFLDPAEVDIPDHVLQHLAGPGQGHLRVNVRAANSLEHPVPELVEFVGEAFNPGNQVLE